MYEGRIMKKKSQFIFFWKNYYLNSIKKEIFSNLGRISKHKFIFLILIRSRMKKRLWIL